MTFIEVEPTEHSDQRKNKELNVFCHLFTSLFTKVKEIFDAHSLRSNDLKKKRVD